MNNLIPLKKIIEDLKGEDKIPIGYQSFRQAYLGNKLNEDVVKYIVKKDGEFRINWNKLDELIKDITRNKKRWLDWDKLRSEGDKALRRGEISQRQYKDMFGDNGKLGYLLMLMAMKEEERSLD